MNIFYIAFILNKKRIILSLILIFLLFLCFSFPAFSSQENNAKIIISQGQLVAEKVIGVYTYRQYVSPPNNNDIFQLFQGEQLVYQSQVVFGFSHYPIDEMNDWTGVLIYPENVSIEDLNWTEPLQLDTFRRKIRLVI